MTLILGIDPGITTGCALVDVQPRSGDKREVSDVQKSMSFFAGDLLVGLHDQDLLELLADVEVIAMEDTPVPTLGKMNRQLGAVIRYLIVAVVASGVPKVVYPTPGMWKPVVGKIKRRDLFGDWHPDTRHEEDAARIALFVGEQILEQTELAQ